MCCYILSAENIPYSYSFRAKNIHYIYICVINKCLHPKDTPYSYDVCAKSIPQVYILCTQNNNNFQVLLSQHRKQIPILQL